MDDAHRVQTERPEGAPPDVATAAIFLSALGASAVLSWSDRSVYAFLFGGLNPLLVTAVVAGFGGLGLRRLVAVKWFPVGTASRRNAVRAALLGAALTIPVVLVDVFGGFPAGMNVGFPESLLFYPSIALVAECGLHVVPLALMATVWSWTSLDRSRARLLAIGGAAVIEPILQVVWGSGQSPIWANVYVGVHLLVFNVVGLEIFRRFGFVTLYGFRVGYYLLWHIVWGYARLPLLFPGGS